MKNTRKRATQVYNIYEDIKRAFGKSKYYSWLPNLILYTDASASWNGMWLYGDFDVEDKCITVNIAAHRTLRQVVSTILHEYRHYLQSPSWYTQYEKMCKYAEHPYEKDADDFALEHVDKFVNTKR